jgi:hypothetical protein
MSTSLLHIDLLLICSVHSFDQLAPLPLQRAVSDGQLLHTDVTADDTGSDNFKLFPILSTPHVSRFLDSLTGETYPAVSCPAPPQEGTFSKCDPQLDLEWERHVHDEPRLDPGTYHPYL